MPHSAFLIGGLARLTGCNIETIRYYERAGVLPTPKRRGRYRTYTQQDAERLRFVRRARELGFSLDDVRALLRLTGGKPLSCKQASVIASRQLADARAKITDLRRVERVLADAVRACNSGVQAECPLISSLSSPG